MPAKRTRRSRTLREIPLIPEELEWLTGEPQEGAGKLWSFLGGAAKAERCRTIVREHADLIPRGRRAALLRDIVRWDDPKPRGLASFR